MAMFKHRPIGLTNSLIFTDFQSYPTVFISTVSVLRCSCTHHRQLVIQNVQAVTIALVFKECRPRGLGLDVAPMHMVSSTVNVFRGGHVPSQTLVAARAFGASARVPLDTLSLRPPRGERFLAPGLRDLKHWYTLHAVFTLPLKFSNLHFLASITLWNYSSRQDKAGFSFLDHPQMD